SSKTYCDEIKAVLAEHRLVITELSTHLQGHLVAVHPAYDTLVDGFAAPAVRGRPSARAEWAVGQVKAGAKACRNLGLDTMVSFTGALAWPFLYPFPPRPAGLIETAFDELARRWKPILDYCDSQGVNVGFELHPGEDVFDGATFDMLLEWECCLKHPEDGAREGAGFIRDHIIRVTERAFDDFADSGVDQGANRRLLGLDGKAS